MWSAPEYGLLAACAGLLVLRCASGDTNQTVTAEHLHCLACSSDRLPACYLPVTENRVGVRECDPSVKACYTQFRPSEVVERDCLVYSSVRATHSCASSLCNRTPGAAVPLPGESQIEWKKHLSEVVERDCLVYSSVRATHSCASSLCNRTPSAAVPLPGESQVEWKKHLRSIKEFMKSNQEPLRCVSCEATEDDRHVLLHDDCYIMPEEKVNKLSEKCHRNEVCETVLEPGRVTRGCTRTPRDSAMAVCATDECNNHVDIEQELRLRREQRAEEAEAAASPAVSARAGAGAAILVLAVLILIMETSQ